MNLLNKAFHIEYSEEIPVENTHLHHHTTHEIIFVREGSANFLIENKKYTIKKNSLLFISNFEKHRLISITEPYKRFFLLADNEFLSSGYFDRIMLSVFLNRPQNFCHKIDLGDEDALKIEEIFLKLNEENENSLPYKDHIIKLKICEMLIFIFRKHTGSFYDFGDDSYAGTIMNVQTYLNTHFKESLTLKEVAGHFHTNMYYLSTKFKEIVGFSFKEYLTKLRVSYAKYLLITTNISVSKIHAECGFNDSANFFRVFKTNENMSPLKYRTLFLKSKKIQ